MNPFPGIYPVLAILIKRLQKFESLLTVQRRLLTKLPHNVESLNLFCGAYARREQIHIGLKQMIG